MTARELGALPSGQLYGAGILRSGRRRFGEMDRSTAVGDELIQDGDRDSRGDSETGGNDADLQVQLTSLQEILELGERALERERGERIREQQEWKESVEELKSRLQASLQEADKIRSTMELEKLREVEALRRQSTA